jgi:hypothetical protein
LEPSSGAGEDGWSSGSGASSESVISIAREASSIDADALIEEESIVADLGADSVGWFLSVGALGVGDTALGGGVNGESAQAGSTGGGGSWTLSAVGVAGHASSTNGSESSLAAGHTVSVGDDAWGTDADVVERSGTWGAGSLTFALEEVESREAASAGSGSVTSVAGVGAVGADSTTRSDGSVGTAGTEVEGWAGGTVGRTVHTDLLSGIEELGSLASLLADGSRSDVSGSAGGTVGGEEWASVAWLGTGNTDSLETKLVFAAGDSASSIGGDWTM